MSLGNENESGGEPPQVGSEGNNEIIKIPEDDMNKIEDLVRRRGEKTQGLEAIKVFRSGHQGRVYLMKYTGDNRSTEFPDTFVAKVY